MMHPQATITKMSDVIAVDIRARQPRTKTARPHSGQLPEQPPR